MSSGPSRKLSVTKSRKQKADENIQVYPCGKCSKACQDEINCSNDKEFSIECENCQKWYHRKCIETLSDREWDSLTGNNPNILFKCQACIGERAEKNKEIKALKKDINSEMSGLRDKIDDFQSILQENNKTLILELEKIVMPKVEKMIDERIKTHSQEISQVFEDRFKRLESEVKEKKADSNQADTKQVTQANLEKMMADVKEAEVNIEKKIETELKVYLEQKHDKDSRKNNIIILRLEEQEGDNEEERIKNDRKEIKKLLNVTNPELEAELETIIPKKSSLRLGRKKDGVSRPVKIKLSDEEMKKDIFRGCKNLRNSTYNHVYIQNDLSKEEQEKNYKMRQELRERKEKGEKVCIYQNEIINESDHPRNRRTKPTQV